VRHDVLMLAAELAARREPFVLATVVRRMAASSAQSGDAALVTAAGEFHGWLGGSCTQPVVIREALAALAAGEPRLIALSPEPEAEGRAGVTAFPMTCHSGGTVDIYVEPILPARRLVVFGHSPVARAIARAAAATGFAVDVADSGGDHGAPDAAGAGRVFTDLSALAPEDGPPAIAVVATMGEDDEAAVAAAVRLAPAYLGVVASPKRFEQMRETLVAMGVAAADLDRVHSPAGLDIGARTPEEIAVSILAQVVSLTRARTAGERPRADERPKAAALPSLPSASPPAARSGEVDPVCGMAVDPTTARHTAQLGARTWYFCCAGCRQKFLAEPQRYGAALGAEAR
jgi:xanthine dehydrogenase accessory factor